MNRCVRTLAVSLFALLWLPACGGGPTPPDPLAELNALRGSPVSTAIEEDASEIENAAVRELREQAQTMLAAADRYLEQSEQQWRRGRRDPTITMARIGLLYYRAAENYYRASEARDRLSSANASLQSQMERRNDFMERLQGEQELIEMLDTIQALFERNEELRRELATVQEQARTESRALYAIQEARIEQRTAEGMRAEQHAVQTFRDAQQLLTRAQTRFEDGRHEEAYEIALQALDLFRRSGEEARPRFMTEQDRLLRDDFNRRLYEEAQRTFGDRALIDARGMVILLPNLFESRAADVRDSRAEDLDRVLEIMRRYDRLNVRVEGHTDDRASGEGAMALSQTRADTVQNYFLQRGIPNRRLSTAGHGADQPVFDNRTEDGRANNNRVEVIFVFR